MHKREFRPTREHPSRLHHWLALQSRCGIPGLFFEAELEPQTEGEEVEIGPYIRALLNFGISMEIRQKVFPYHDRDYVPHSVGSFYFGKQIALFRWFSMNFWNSKLVLSILCNFS